LQIGWVAYHYISDWRLTAHARYGIVSTMREKLYGFQKGDLVKFAPDGEEDDYMYGSWLGVIVGFPAFRFEPSVNVVWNRGSKRVMEIALRNLKVISESR